MASNDLEEKILDKIDSKNVCYLKFKRIKQKTIELLLVSSAHGIPSILRTRHIFIKIMWLIFTLISFGFTSNLVVKSTLDYLEYNTVSSVNIIQEFKSQFPTITFCRTPSFLNNSLEDFILRLRYNFIYEKNLTNFFQSFYDDVYGQCYRFNSGINLNNEKVNLLNSSKKGLLHGLRIDLYQDVPEGYDFNKIRLFIHNHSNPPIDILEQGTWVTSGGWYRFQIERTFYERLGDPFNNCLKGVNEFDKNKTIINYISKLNRSYTQSTCHEICIHLAILEKSNCNCSTSLNEVPKYCIKKWSESSNLSEQKQCVEKFLKEKFETITLDQRCSKYCPLECDSMSFKITPYFEHFPTSIGLISRQTKLDEGLMNFSTYEDVRKHYASILIYYKDLKYTLIRQEPRTEVFSYVSTIGGIFGLFLGVSFLSFIEIFEILFEALYILFSSRN